MLPIATVNSPHRLQCQIDMNNFIGTQILEDIYPEYANYDPTLKQSFKQSSREGAKQEEVKVSIKEGGKLSAKKEQGSGKEKKEGLFMSFEEGNGGSG